ncbi:MAG: 4-(cytidine 5'-diphospho)-2-C-methyl-D-erythritol kinase [Candidatus Marinimicrobia bacterium]|nr:4-(cytidine 5'-diphospho)-2-C-methyl-D-erythritol kinase [Candidatus Neomarinimicrobiota bacterium]MBL7108981.1 4-(cytidine 5'-diphospho)-2-C-methyl-D-erythritol kinase [Candidatus Neomarinimicrobiota bacterium]
MKIKSNAKINIGLIILNKREDGYHNIDTVFAELDWGDTLMFDEVSNKDAKSQSSKYPISNIQHQTLKSQLPADDSNLITKAYKLLRSTVSEVPTEYQIKLIKRIPMGGGLGGGSSNASATLIALNQLWGLDYSAEKLQSLGAQLGADVPFFIKGGVQRGQGIGEKLQPIKLNEDWFIVIVVPPIHCSTADAYRDYKKYLPVNWNNRNITGSELTDKELTGLRNDFEPMIFDKFTEIEKIKSQLIKAGAIISRLSGSGSAVYGVFQTKDLAQQCQSSIDSSYFSIVTKIKK